MGIGYYTIHNWDDATCNEAANCSICGRTQGEPLGHDWKSATCLTAKECSVCGTTEGSALGHQWTEEAYDKMTYCLSCGMPNGSIITLDDTSVNSYFTDQNVTFSLDGGKQVGCSIIKLYQTVQKCTSVAINLEITELRSRNVHGEWGFYIRDLDENWHLVDPFELNGDSVRVVIPFEEPTDFDAWACPCHVLGDYWDFNFSVWLDDAKVFHYEG